MPNKDSLKCQQNGRLIAFCALNIKGLHSLGPVACIHVQTRQLDRHCYKAMLSSHGRVQLELFAGEAAPNSTVLEKHSSC